ncbi:alpha/beta hydrolase [Erythrobacter sp. SCSIO 43205]|uniref:alpha/beta hydrolase fold domain-containing protein n=1 Tax=Erythrobacter sp. SCSIO 43205 TaxID=2779361 RepID=UPI001CA81E8B|nr:alpha/beta hydrolase [Erythrobacter sp. SCSIO 43205]UAB78136.1 alpha/beta hydrolase [Erythrobacter sp. SCSIO 43205]
MLTSATTQLRSPKPSLLMRGVKWLMSKRPSVFPHDARDVEPFLFDRNLPKDAPVPEGFRKKFRVEEWEAAGQQVITLHPKSGTGDWHMLYFHGGGFVLPMFKEHWPLIEAMVERLGVSVSAPLYEVVPESPHTRQDELADAAFAKIAASHDPAKIILNGDSAGGHMALSLALRLAGAGGAQPGKLALFAPWLDLTMADPAMQDVEPHDIMLKIGTLRACGKVFAGEGNPADPQFSPLYTSKEELANLPPTRIWTGRHDLFIIDSRTFAGKLVDAGVDAKLYEYEGAPHVFMAIVPTCEAKDCLQLLGEFLKE